MIVAIFYLLLPAHMQGYSPVIYYPKKTSKDIYQILVAQCEKLNIPFLDSLPSAIEIDSQYLVVVDAIFGFSFSGSVRVPFDTILSTLRDIKTPIASVDIPSGQCGMFDANRRNFFLCCTLLCVHMSVSVCVSLCICLYMLVYVCALYM